MALTMTATRRSSRLWSKWLSSVVFPASKKPESTVTASLRPVRLCVPPDTGVSMAGAAESCAGFMARIVFRMHNRSGYI